MSFVLDRHDDGTRVDCRGCRQSSYERDHFACHVMAAGATLGLKVIE